MNTDILLDSRRNSRKYVFLTGATGLLGSYLMRDLFLGGCHLAVVVRPSKRLDVQQRIEVALQRWEKELGRTLPRPVIFEGDVCLPNLGLGAADLLWVREHCDRLIHSAAVLQFNSAPRDEDPWRTNLGGTENVLKFSKLVGISGFHYVSTAYVCGKRETPVQEHDLDCGQDFRNDYERSKFEAEKLVNAATGFTSKTIYRPAVIVGDSKTGYTSTYHGLFLYLRLLATLVPQQKRNEEGVIETPIRLPLSGDEPRNLVPVDWVSDVITQIFLNPEAHGQTYHLVPDECITARKLIEFCCSYFNSCGVEFCGDNTDHRDESEFSKHFFENVSIYKSYETSDPVFDNRNVAEFAPLACPVLDKEMTASFLEFGIANRWGKKRDKAPAVECWFGSQLASIAKAATQVLSKADSNLDRPIVKFGLDVHGPGGGQWQLTAGKDGKFEVSVGLPDASLPVLTIDASEINTLLAAADSEQSESSPTACPAAIWLDSIESILTPSRVR